MYTQKEFETFVTAYRQAMEFANDEIFDEATESPELSEKILDDCKKFLDKAGRVIQRCEELGLFDDAFNQAGYDFYFTRNHDGVGFWESEWYLSNGSTIFSDFLTKSAQKFSEIYIYVGDDGLIYQS